MKRRSGARILRRRRLQSTNSGNLRICAKRLLRSHIAEIEAGAVCFGLEVGIPGLRLDGKVYPSADQSYIHDRPTSVAEAGQGVELSSLLLVTHGIIEIG